MKNKSKVPFVRLFGIIALVAVVVFSMTACGDDNSDNNDNGSDPQTATYTGTSGGQTYTLKITENTARYTAQSGDAYELTVGSKKSTGTVSNIAGSVLTLKPSNATTTFTATISGTSLTALNDTITWTDNTTATAPGSLTGGNGGGEVTNSTFTITGIPAEFNGKYVQLGTQAQSEADLSITGAQMGSNGMERVEISNGSVSIPLWVRNKDTYEYVRYSGNDTVSLVGIAITNAQMAASAVAVGTIRFSSITFVNGGATRSWSQGQYTASSGGGEGGTFTLNNIPSDYNGKYVYLTILPASGSQALASGFQSMDMSTATFTLCLISNGSVSVPLWIAAGNELVRYTGSDTAGGFRGQIYTSQTMLASNINSNIGSVQSNAQFTFTNGNATKSWNDGTYTPNPNAP